MSEDRARARSFYDADRPAAWGRGEMSEERRRVTEWLERLDARGPTLELGCGAGALAGVGEDYVALDLALTPLRRIGGRAVLADMEALPFREGSVGSVFTWAAMEHVPHPERVLAEVARVLRGAGVAIFAPAWHCRPWAAEGLEFRPYSALRTTQKIRKALIPLRNAIWWRAIFEVPRRISRELRGRSRAMPFEYDRLSPNLDEYVGTDSDAFTSMDPQAVAIWFASRGWDVVSHRTMRERMLARHEAVVARKR
ncbi:MAG TPA: class I SAM-dependent methyltransferase [Thermoanaerobaculia bacterium]|nr:class I SAM-dependent methyltransferase [Thermoanaerobaculia bacterium]